MSYLLGLKDPFPNGKYQGKAVAYVLKTEPTFLAWAIENLADVKFKPEVMTALVNQQLGSTPVSQPFPPAPPAPNWLSAPALPVPPVRPTPYTSVKEETMSNVQVVVAQNKNAAVSAVKLQVGKIAVETVAAAIRPHLPLMVRGYADHSAFNVVVANILNVAVQKFAPNNAKAKVVAEAAMEYAYFSLVDSFNATEMLQGLLNKIPTASLEALTGQLAE